MKKKLIRLICVLLIIFTFPLWSISGYADTYVKGVNSASDSYRSGPYYDRLLSVKLTGDNRRDVVAVALSQVGYQEGDSNDFSGTVGGKNNFTEYNYNFGKYNNTDGYGYQWCASFVSFCLLQAGCHSYTSIYDWCRNHTDDGKYIWKEISCQQWAKQLRKYNYFKDSQHYGGNYIPLPGDIIFFTDGTKETHVGIVLYASGSTVCTVEGNTTSASGLDTNGGGVYVKSYALSSSYIRGYGVMPYVSKENVTEIDYSGGNISKGLYVATVNKYVYATADATQHSWVLPAYSMFNVIGIESNNLVKAECTINGSKIIGYISNNTDRIIQATATEAFSPYQSAKTLWNYKAAYVDGYTVNGGALQVGHSTLSVTVGDKISIQGWIGYNTRRLASAGYCIDGDTSNIVWNKDWLITPEDAVIAAGGSNAKRFLIAADTATVPQGAHDITYFIKLDDGSIGTVATVSYNASAPDPSASPTAKPTATPTVKPTATPTKPSATPTVKPTAAPTVTPTESATVIPSITTEGAEDPTDMPQQSPTAGLTVPSASAPATEPDITATKTDITQTVTPSHPVPTQKGSATPAVTVSNSDKNVGEGTSHTVTIIIFIGFAVISAVVFTIILLIKRRKKQI